MYSSTYANCVFMQAFFSSCVYTLFLADYVHTCVVYFFILHFIEKTFYIQSYVALCDYFIISLLTLI